MSIITLESMVKRTGELPALSQAALSAIRATESSDSTAASIAAIIGMDQALSARILKLANSSFYGLARRVSETREAIVILGMPTVRSLCILAATMPLLSKSLKGYETDAHALTRHALGVAIGAQTIAKRSKCVSPDEAFTAGLLHNIGKLVLSVWIEDKLNGMVLLATQTGTTFDEIERKVMGYDHCEVGAHLAENWNLPPSVVQSIRFHHSPWLVAGPDRLVDVVHLADFFAMSFGCGLGGDGLQYAFDDECVLRLGLDPGDFDELAHEFLDAFEKQESFLQQIAA